MLHTHIQQKYFLIVARDYGASEMRLLLACLKSYTSDIQGPEFYYFLPPCTYLHKVYK